MAVVADDVEQQVIESVATEQRMLRRAVQLPPARIVFVPFSLVEVELLPEDE
ncbi:MAG TPA: hypothetical protein VFH48_16590 [Chloroflexota bacterium]|nr:hypothetical protein [Chloroflexota bacterium]